MSDGAVEVKDNYANLVVEISDEDITRKVHVIDTMIHDFDICLE
jgi:hypothetical protein